MHISHFISILMYDISILIFKWKKRIWSQYISQTLITQSITLLSKSNWIFYAFLLLHLSKTSLYVWYLIYVYIGFAKFLCFGFQLIVISFYKFWRWSDSNRTFTCKNIIRYSQITWILTTVLLQTLHGMHSAGFKVGAVVWTMVRLITTAY